VKANNVINIPANEGNQTKNLSEWIGQIDYNPLPICNSPWAILKIQIWLLSLQ